MRISGSDVNIAVPHLGFFYSAGGGKDVFRNIGGLRASDHHVTIETEDSSNQCPLCGTEELQLKYANIDDRLSVVEEEFDFYMCRHCGSVSVLPMPNENETSKFYPPSYKVRAPSSNGNLAGKVRRIEWQTLFLPVYRSGQRAVMDMTGVKAGKLLEIGCSSGYQLLEFAKSGDFEIYGLDIDGSAVDHARRELGLNVVNESLFQANLPPSSFDVVILFNVLEHLVNPLEVLREVNRILRPGGYLAIKTQIINSVQGRLFGRRWLMVDPPRHLSLASTSGIERVLAGAGMRLVHRRSGPLQENAVSVALSILPNATSQLAFGRGRAFRGYAFRLAGILLSISAIPLVLLENAFGRSGTMIYVAQKAE